MKCKVCGAESGKYPLCMECNKKKEAGEIIKCPKCQKWHLTSAPCAENTTENNEAEGENEKFLYELKASLVTKSEAEFLSCIKAVLPENCMVQPQANLASFIARTDGARFQNELYRNVDFIITDLEYRPLIVVEVNDPTHLAEDRRERDKKVTNICEEAGIPIIKLWTSYGVNREYIEKRITETLLTLPIKRVHHFVKEKQQKQEKVISPTVVSPTVTQAAKKKGCYIATCIYGSYDCPQVWTLRRYRDGNLDKSWFGRAFIKVYYVISPICVKAFGNRKLFRAFGKKCLDAFVLRLQGRGIADSPYTDL